MIFSSCSSRVASVLWGAGNSWRRRGLGGRLQFTPFLPRVFNFVGLVPGICVSHVFCVHSPRDIQVSIQNSSGLLRLKMSSLACPALRGGENKDFLWARGVTSFVKKTVQRALLRPLGEKGGSGGALGQDKVFLLSP